MFGRIQTVDNKVLYNISKIHKPALTKIMVTASKLGNFGFVWWAICVPFFVVPEWRITGFSFVFALCFAHIWGEIIIKHIVKRTRPCHLLDDDEQIINKPRFYSFPSGHTTASFAFVATALVRCQPAVCLPIIVLAFTISFSRIYLRVHYLTDVVCGMLLGLTSGFVASALFNYLFI